MGNQMLLVLLAAVLFSTVVLYTYDHIFTQRELVYNGMYMLQGQKIADSLFQRIGCEFLSATFDNATTFESVATSYVTYSSADTITIDGISYNVMLASYNSSQFGNILSPFSLPYNYRRIDIWIDCSPNGTDVISIGTAANPLTKIYANNGM